MRTAFCVPATILGLLLAFAPRGAAQDREEILSYDAAIELADGGRMDVTETLSVRVLGDDIRHGIFRDIPTSFPRASGLGRITAPFEVVEVRRDGAPEPYRLESIGGSLGRGGVRIRIGNGDVDLPHGVHEYEIHYRTWRWVAFGDDADELYWNVTGNGWDFPILHASARIRLPRPVDASAVTLQAWTGPEGSTESQATDRWEPDATAFFQTDAPLGPREGLTVSVIFPKGVVAPPSQEVQDQWFRMDWGGWIDAATVLGLVLALYLFMWSRVGRDPDPGPLVVRYEPPDDFSPAGVGYVVKRGWQTSLLSAALVHMAVKGTVHIEKAGHTWTLHTVDAPTDALTLEERDLRDALLGSRRSLELKSKNAKTISEAVKEYRRALARRFQKEYFLLNRAWFAGGLTVSLACLGALAWRDRYGIPPEAWFFTLWLSFWSLGVAGLLTAAWKAWRLALGGAGFGAWGGAIFITLFATPFVGAEIFVGGMLTTRVPQHLLGAAVGLGVLNVLFYHLLERPTLRGRGVLNAIEGFAAFLTATEADRLDRMTAPQRTPELFERYLPYAIALGVENRWAKSFESALGPAVSGTSSGVPRSGTSTWYSGVPAGDFSGLASSLGSAFSSSLSSASSPPSSGGSGGGGSSGGGGGGGGGGGW